MDGCRPAMVFDPNPASLDRVRALSPSIPATDDFHDFLKAEIDIVAICSPDRTHAGYIVDSFAAGKHVLCEKPLTDSLEGCREILNAEKKAGGLVGAVQHQMRFLPVHRRMKELISAGALGIVSYAEGYYVHNLIERAGRFDQWRFEQGATPLVYAGCHFVDLLRWLLDDEVEEVSAMANHLAFPDYPESDLNTVLLRFRSGAIGNVVVAFGAARPQDHSVRVYGTRRSIENNLLFEENGDFMVIARPFLQKPYGPSIRWRAWAKDIKDGLKAILAGRATEWLLSPFRGKAGEYSVQGYPFRLYEHSHAVRASLEDFVRAVRTRSRPLCTLLEGAKTAATCLAGVEAYRTGQTVSMGAYWLPEFGDAPGGGAGIARASEKQA